MTQQTTFPLLLSIIIPAHNEEFRLPGSLVKIDAYLSQQEYSYEVIVVENGSVDNTVGVVQQFATEHPYVRLMMVDTRGKGLAVKAGMLAAQGEPVNIGGYYLPDPELTAKQMRPSKTFNDIIDAM